MLRIRTFLLTTIAPLLAFSPLALAQEAAPAAEPAAESDAEADPAVKDALDTGGTERAGKQYLFVGARYRMVVIPEFIQHSCGTSSYTGAVQPEKLPATSKAPTRATRRRRMWIFRVMVMGKLGVARARVVGQDLYETRSPRNRRKYAFVAGKRWDIMRFKHPPRDR
jgi:hypothetical protein